MVLVSLLLVPRSAIAMLSIMRLVTGLLFILVCATSVQLEAATPVEAVSLKQFELVDYRGRQWTLDDFKDDSVLVLAFLGTECPLAQHYAVRLQQIADDYRDGGVQIVAVMSNRQDSLAEIASFASRQEIQFPVFKDAGNRLADQVGASRTPEVFVFDAQRKLRYRGRIDDQFGIGYTRQQPRRHDLVIAIDELRSGKAISVSRTEAVGCIIGRAKPINPHSEVSYGNQIAKILNRHCVECHREGEIAPFALTEYDEVAGWADMIAEVVRDGRMPPWHATDQHAEFANDRRLSEQEREMIFAWADSGRRRATSAICHRCRRKLLTGCFPGNLTSCCRLPRCRSKFPPPGKWIISFSPLTQVLNKTFG